LTLSVEYRAQKRKGGSAVPRPSASNDSKYNESAGAIYIVKKSESRRRRTAEAAGATLSLQDAMPESDPAYSILAGILSLVPASRWAFATVAPNGNLVSLFGSHGFGKGLAGWRSALGLAT
jgi:hypothetical protein